MSRPVRWQHQQPSTNATAKPTPMTVSDHRDINTAHSSHPRAVPQVPGAGRNRPLPSPNATSLVPDLNTHPAVGSNKIFSEALPESAPGMYQSLFDMERCRSEEHTSELQ